MLLSVILCTFNKPGGACQQAALWNTRFDDHIGSMEVLQRWRQFFVKSHVFVMCASLPALSFRCSVWVRMDMENSSSSNLLKNSLVSERLSTSWIQFAYGEQDVDVRYQSNDARQDS